jgi:hypothetical protein
MPVDAALNRVKIAALDFDRVCLRMEYERTTKLQRI